MAAIQAFLDFSFAEMYRGFFAMCTLHLLQQFSCTTFNCIFSRLYHCQHTAAELVVAVPVMAVGVVAVEQLPTQHLATPPYLIAVPAQMCQAATSKPGSDFGVNTRKHLEIS